MEAQVEVQNENNFRKALATGMNLFLGAGFSVLAETKAGGKLPTGRALRDELVAHFKLPDETRSLSLDAVCSMIETSQGEQLRKYLKGRFSVGNYDPQYSILDKLAFQNIFTTNVDDLIYKVFASSERHYINDVTIHGPRQRDRAAIDYIPLHGSIVSEDMPLVFGTTRVVTSFRADSDRWHAFTNSLQRYPTLFWGCGMGDADLIQALSPSTIRERPHEEKWIVLHDVDEATIRYFTTVFGFSTVRGDTKGLLSYLSSVDIVMDTPTVKQSTRDVFPLYAIPSVGDVPVRPLKSFYEGFAPTWYDIFTGRIKPTSHFRQVMNLINGDSDVVVLGIPASGKTTLMMQLANDFQFSGHKLVCNSLSSEQATYLVSKLDGQRAVVFVDNFADSIDAFNVLLRAPNVRVVGFDHDTAYETAAHKIEKGSVRIQVITELTQSDMLDVYSAIPEDIRIDSFRLPATTRDVSPSLFEVIEANTRQHLPELRTRYRSLLRSLESEQALHDLLIMIAYVHQCRVPVSYDMALAFLRDQVVGYDEVFQLIDHLGQLITENTDQLVDVEQDYYSPRSSIIADVILSVTSSAAFRRVLLQFHQEVSPVRIFSYDTFKRRGFDKIYAVKAFPNLDYLDEGLAFYQRAFDRDHSYYLLQQAALYLAELKQYHMAFQWIEDALHLSRNRIPSIRNSHAVILFRSNAPLAKAKPSDAEIRKTLDLSMAILQGCYHDDKRKIYHTVTFSEQAIQYWDTYRDAQAEAYLETAKAWLESELQQMPYKRGEMNRLLNSIRSRLQ